MANSSSNLDLISASQANKEVAANSLLDAASPAMLYGRRASTTAGLTFGYYGGTVMIGTTPTQVANGTVTLAASTTNYIESDPATGAVSVNTTGFTSGRTPLYQVVTSASTVSSYTDLRVLGGGGGNGTVKSINTKTPDSSGAVTLIASDVGADASGAAAAAISAHDAASDPHPQYLTQSEGDSRYPLASTEGAANGLATLGSDGKVPTSQLPASATAGGTVTSVGLSTPGVLYSVSGSPVTSSGTLALSLISQAVNCVLAGPAAGGSAAPSFRSLTPADLPVMVGSGTGHAAGIVPDPGSMAGTTRYLREDGTWATPSGTATGTVTSVGLSVPGLLYTVSGSPVTTSGTLTFTLNTQAANKFLAGPTSGAAAAPTMRSIVAADLPVMVGSGGSHAAGIVPDPGATAGTAKYLREDGTWNVPPGTTSGGTPGGATNQLQFNDSGVFGGTSLLAWDKTNNILNYGTSAGTGVTIKGVTSAGAAIAAGLTLAGGDGAGGYNGGKVTIYGGNTGGGSSAGGGVVISGCDPTKYAAGDVTVKGGNMSFGTGGAALVAGGDGVNTGTGGALTLRGGDTAGYIGGDATLRGGDSTSSGGNGGNVTIRGGFGNQITFSGVSTAGTVSITGGNASGNANQAAGGAVTISGGQGGANQGAGGSVTIKGGAPQADNGGGVTIQGAAGVGTNKNGGSVTLTPGAATGTGTPGHVVLNGSGAALATTAIGGFTCVPTCAGAPTGTPANIPTGTVPMVFDTTNKKLWMYVGSSWVGVVLS